MKKAIVLLCLITILGVGCFQSNNPSDNSNELKGVTKEYIVKAEINTKNISENKALTYKNDGYWDANLNRWVKSGGNFEIVPPSNWKQIKEPLAGPKTGATVFFKCQKPDDIDGNDFHANINVGVGANNGYNLDSFVMENVGAMSIGLPEFKLINSERISINGIIGHVLESVSKQFNIIMRTKTLIIVKPELIYVVTTTAPNKTWDKYSDIFDEAMFSFKV